MYRGFNRKHDLSCVSVGFSYDNSSDEANSRRRMVHSGKHSSLHTTLETQLLKRHDNIHVVLADDSQSFTLQNMFHC